MASGRKTLSLIIENFLLALSLLDLYWEKSQIDLGPQKPECFNGAVGLGCRLVL